MDMNTFPFFPYSSFYLSWWDQLLFPSQPESQKLHILSYSSSNKSRKNPGEILRYYAGGVEWKWNRGQKNCLWLDNGNSSETSWVSSDLFIPIIEDWMKSPAFFAQGCLHVRRLPHLPTTSAYSRLFPEKTYLPDEATWYRSQLLSWSQHRQWWSNQRHFLLVWNHLQKI